MSGREEQRRQKEKMGGKRRIYICMYVFRRYKREFAKRVWGEAKMPLRERVVGQGGRRVGTRGRKGGKGLGYLVMGQVKMGQTKRVRGQSGASVLPHKKLMQAMGA